MGQLASNSFLAGDHSFTSENNALMKFPSSKRNKLLKRDNVILFNCEMWGNKEDGIKTKLMRGHFVNCKIRQNVRGAI